MGEVGDKEDFEVRSCGDPLPTDKPHPERGEIWVSTTSE